MTDAAEKTELGLLPRLIAAGWFAVAACIPVVFFIFWFDGPEGFGVYLFLLSVVPISLAAFFGFAVGVKILDPVRTTSKLWAAARGVVVALLSHLVFMTLYVVQLEMSGPAPVLGFVLMVAMIGMTITSCRLRSSADLPAGGFAICRFGKICGSGCWTRPRVSTTTAYIWIVAAALPVLLIFIAGVYLVRSVR